MGPVGWKAHTRRARSGLGRRIGTLGAGKSATITVSVTATTKGTVEDTATAADTKVVADADGSATASTKVLG